MAKGKQKKQIKKKSGPETLKGKLDISRSGTGFVSVQGMERDVLVHPENLGNALDGDEVRLEIVKEGKGRTEGVVKEVVSRRQTEFSGKVEVKTHFAFLIPDKQNMSVDILIPLEMLKGAVQGDHAVARITEWTARSRNPTGEIISLLTDESRNEIAMQSILMDAGFPLHFPDDALEEAARYSDAIDKDEVARRKDFRKVLTVTIDPIDAKDFDDALSIQPLEDGWWEIGVHIADVSFFVTKDSPLDKEAYRRATSVYLPDRVLPMLPEHLSNNLCSLRPNEDKYAFSAVFEMNEQGKVRSYWLGRTLIRSRRRFSYEEVQEIIEGAEGDHKKELMLLNSIARKIRGERFSKGAINFSSQEVRFKLDENAKPIGIVVKESKEAHQLIEEFMLLANRTVAEHVGKVDIKGKPVPFPYRVHDVPDEAKLAIFTSFAARFGHKFNLSTAETITRSFNQMLEDVQGRPEQHVLESLGIRTMSKAVYTTENIGHYGLGFEDYCHFTSPIRRYPDVLVHRVLQEVLDNAIIPVKNMEQLCRHSSEQERAAMEAERNANKYKQVEFMQDHVGEEFEAVISGVAAFGFWAETVEHKCEGMIGMSDLSEFDDFVFMESDYCLVGQGTGIRFSIGDKVMVQVAAANLDKRQIDFTLLEIPDGHSRSRKGSAVRKDQKPARGGVAAKSGRSPKRK